MSVKVQRNWNPHTLLLETQNGTATLKNWQLLKILNIELPYDQAIPFLDIYPREMKTYVHIKNEHKCYYLLIIDHHW